MPSQFEDRYQVRPAIDEVLDALHEFGPSRDEHKQALMALSAKRPEFFVDIALLGATYLNDQEGEPDDDTVISAVELVQDEGVVADAESVGAGRLAAGLANLRVSLSRTGHITWVDHTPDEEPPGTQTV